MSDILTITIEGFLQDPHRAQSQARERFVSVTENGAECFVLVPAADFRQMFRRWRRAIKASELSDDDLESIASAEMRPEFDHLNDELEE